MMNRKNGERKKNEGRVEVGQSVDRVKKKRVSWLMWYSLEEVALKGWYFFTPIEYFNYRFLQKETRKWNIENRNIYFFIVLF